MRDKIWDLVYDMIDERHQEALCMYEGVKKYEDEVADIVDDIQELAYAIEQKIQEREDYTEDDQREDEGCRRNHAKGEGD